MRFNADVYGKLFPKQTETKPIETPVETFTPTKDKEEEERAERIEEVETEVPEVDDNVEEGEADGNSDNTD